ncbi:MAG TPA: LacI family DNA-binding transcriptional regulator [Sphingobium sp.]|nr:LacI family DNA-binding transcriptional regulator [Sphingobium sp.]
MPSIHDVAALAGVSIKTVSRVVNQAPNVSAELRERVTAAIRQIDYRPNQSARRLAGGRSFMIAFLYNNPAPSYTSGIQAGAVHRCRDLGYHLVVEMMPLAGDERFAILEGLVAALRPDGVFLAPPLSDDPSVLQWLADRKIACARIAGSISADSLNIPTPERMGGRMVADHLAALGHRRIGVIAPPAGHGAAQQRVEGFREGLAAAGLAIEPDLFVEGEFDYESGLAAGKKLLDRAERPSAIFATNDDMALGVLAAAHQSGLQIPADLSVVGFDDTPASLTAWPPLTTVRQPLDRMGAAVIDALIDPSKDAPAFSFELVERESSAAWRG